MAKRYYVCRIVGDGSDEAPYRPKVADYPVSWVAVLSSNVDGTPKLPWALVLVDTVNHDIFLNDAQIKALPEVSLDLTWGTLSANVRNKVITALQGEGIDTSWIKTSTLIREIIRGIGKAQEPTFSENNFDVVG